MAFSIATFASSLISKKGMKYSNKYRWYYSKNSFGFVLANPAFNHSLNNPSVLSIYYRPFSTPYDLDSTVLQTLSHRY